MFVFSERLLGWLLGFSFFVPAFVIANVGNATGIQSALVFAILWGVVRVWRRGPALDARTGVLVAVWLIGLLGSSISADLSSRSFRAMIAFSANVMLVLVFASCRVSRADVFLFKGMIAGAVVNSIYAVYQQLAPLNGLPFAIPPLNNLSFALYSDYDSLASGARSYAFCPEPSVLAALLIPIFCFLVGRVFQFKRALLLNWLTMVTVFSGLVMSGSLSLFISLPIALGIAALIVFRRRRGIVLSVAVALSALGVGALIVIVWPVAADLLAQVGQRMSAGSEDKSLVVRFGAKKASFGVFLEHPFFGDGIAPPEDDFIAHFPVAALEYEVKTGTDSFVLQILSGQGAVGFGCFIGLVVLGIRRSINRPLLLVLLLTSIATMAIQVGYDSLYHVWVLLGLCNAGGALNSDFSSARHHGPFAAQALTQREDQVGLVERPAVNPDVSRRTLA